MRLADYGYSVSTGPLVWNRHKPQLRARRSSKAIPLIWSECVTSDGRFSFRCEKKNHKPYFEPADGDEWLVIRSACVLVQRTTAKEQKRRLIAAELPATFVEEHGGVVVENHLNMVLPRCRKPAVAPPILAALLNSRILDEAFRCLSGSVAVSAYELESLPLPAPGALSGVDALLRSGADRPEVDHHLAMVFWRGAPS